jgi:uncharacterized damage-inducible protein DinB
MPINEMILPEFDEEMKATRRMLERVPDGKFDYKPHEKSMALGRLASHVAELPSWAAHTMQSEVLEIQAGQKPYQTNSNQQLVADFDKNVAEARKLIAAASDGDFQKMWTFKYGGQTMFSMPRLAVLRSVVMNHMIHHRAQLSVYLRLNEIEVPGMYGPSADEMKFWSAQKA